MRRCVAAVAAAASLLLGLIMITPPATTGPGATDLPPSTGYVALGYRVRGTVWVTGWSDDGDGGSYDYATLAYLG